MPGRRGTKLDGKQYRRWTTLENSQLVALALAEGRAMCPVCCYTVTIQIQQMTRRAETVHLLCENCGNRGGAARDLAGEGEPD
jgi:hypothetical protein